MSILRFDHESMLVHKHLMNKVQNGTIKESSDAFGELFKLTYDFTLLHARLALPNRFRGHAHDLVSTVFLGLWKSRMSYNPKYEVCNWIHGSVRRRATDFYRLNMISRDNKNKELFYLEEIEDYKNKFSYVTIEDEFDHETRLVLRNRINKLPEPHRTITIESIYNSKDSFEIAKLVSYSQRSVNMYLVKAKKILAEELASLE